MNKKSTQIAIGGVFSALCLLLMFLTGLVPFATYALPAIAGAMLVAVVVENGRKTAVLVYISVSLLSLLIVPDREAALMFLAFFGYYPIIKQPIERVGSRLVQLLLKLLLFNAAIVGSFWVVIHVFGIAEMMSDLGGFGQYSALVLLLVGNVVFVMYDYILSRYTEIYIHWFKPRFLRR